MKLDPGMHISLHLVFFGKSGVTTARGCHGRRGSSTRARVAAWVELVEDDPAANEHGCTPTAVSTGSPAAAHLGEASNAL
jgi:hypothetical protein